LDDGVSMPSLMRFFMEVFFVVCRPRRAQQRASGLACYVDVSGLSLSPEVRSKRRAAGVDGIGLRECIAP